MQRVPKCSCERTWSVLVPMMACRGVVAACNPQSNVLHSGCVKFPVNLSGPRSTTHALSLSLMKEFINLYYSSCGNGGGEVSPLSSRRCCGAGDMDSQSCKSASSPILCSCNVRMYSLRTSFILPLFWVGIGETREEGK